MTHALAPVLGEDEWARCWARVGALPPTGVHARLLASHREPHRAYHTLQHLEECLTLRRALDTQGNASAEIDLALWFHDAVYVPMRDDNEERSARWLDTAAAQAGVDAATRRRLHDLVMATRHAVAPHTDDEALLVDIDLSILGAPVVRFDEYEAQIRREYRWVPEPLYRRKRRELLAGFLARPQLYATMACRQRFEAQARANLARSIAALQ